ncbi:MAG: ankyrin repeat domain-containing protein [Halomonadaceae bacterium]|nr:MAG: ankyrin repeat domain-containing protein [Halomonadaceae bacterium]
MGMAKNGFQLLIIVFLGLCGACKPWGTNMQIRDYFEPEYVQLIRAIEGNNEGKARQLVADGLTLNVHGNEGITPLFWLIMGKNNAAVKMALELGADPDFRAGNGRHLVPTLAGGNDDELLELLLKAGGDPNATDLDGKPSIFRAIGHDRWAQIKLLLKYGADPNLTDRSNKNSAHYAAILNKFDMVAYLIEQGADHRNRNAAGGDIAWLIHDRLTDELMNPEYPAYEWALKVKKMLIGRGVEFPPPSPKTVRERWALENE